MLAHLVVLGAVALPLLLVLRVYMVLPPQASPRRGHTAEMQTLLRDIDFTRYTPRTYVYCPGDSMSLRAIADVETTKASGSYTLLPLPRARRVGQSLPSTLISTAWTLLVALRDLFVRPLLTRPSRPWVEVLLVNGPGTCVALVAVSYIRRILGLSYTRIIYVESFARVDSLSLSAKILRPVVETFVVQWPHAAGRGGVEVDPNPSASSSSFSSSSSLTRLPKVKAGSNAGSTARKTDQTRSSGRVTYRGWLV
ncbi:UDP-N-acetylglucosamine transferase subunit ALG14, partial [Saitozyma sp. JCM 24511]